MKSVFSKLKKCFIQFQIFRKLKYFLRLNCTSIFITFLVFLFSSYTLTIISEFYYHYSFIFKAVLKTKMVLKQFESSTC